jgi:hypothetical protein
LPGGAAVRFRREIRLGKTGLLLTIKAGRNAALPGRRHSPSIAWKIRFSDGKRKLWARRRSPVFPPTISHIAYSRRIELRGFRFGEETGSDDEADPFGRFQREAVAAAGDDVDRQLAVRPVFELRGSDVERTSVDDPEQNLPRSDPKVALSKAHRRASLAASAGKMKDHRAEGSAHALGERERLRSEDHAVGHGEVPSIASTAGDPAAACAACRIAFLSRRSENAPPRPRYDQKNPSAFGL